MQRGYLVSFLQRRHHVLLDEGLLLHFHILEGLAVRTMERTLPRLRTTQNLPAQLSENVFKALDLCLQESEWRECWGDVGRGRHHTCGIFYVNTMAQVFSAL